jgi:hypothetical protein
MAMLTPSNSDWKRVQERWQVLLPRVAAYWTRLTVEELENLPGDRASLVAVVKRRYALATSEAEAQVETWFAGVARELNNPVNDSSVPPPARTKDEQRAEGEGMGVAPGASKQ